MKLFASSFALCLTLLLSSSAPAASVEKGYTPIFNGRDLTGWQGLDGDTSSYYVKDGQLICKGDGKKKIFSTKQYANFILRFEVKMDPGGNNGIGIRAKLGNRVHTEGMEIQIIDNPYYRRGIPRPDKASEDWVKLSDYQYHGSIYGVVPAKKGFLKPAGEWNEQEILCNGRHVRVTLNGEIIVDADLDKVKPLDGQEHPGLHYVSGYLALCAHGDYGAEVAFRNMRIKELP